MVFITGQFKDFIIIFLLIITHEFGHLLMAKIFKWNIEKIAIYPFGGCVFFNEKINRPIYEEFLILISGPIFQIVFFIIITILFNNSFLNYRNYLLFKSYHYTLLAFNLLPVYPLDGGKLLNILCYYIFPYKKGNKFVILFSYLLILLLIIYYKQLNFLIMGVFLLSEVTFYLKKQDYLFNKFLLERYLKNYNFKKLKIISNKNNMYKEKRHLFKINDVYYTEKEVLKNRYFKGDKL